MAGFLQAPKDRAFNEDSLDSSISCGFCGRVDGRLSHTAQLAYPTARALGNQFRYEYALIVNNSHWLFAGRCAWEVSGRHQVVARFEDLDGLHARAPYEEAPPQFAPW